MFLFLPAALPNPHANDESLESEDDSHPEYRELFLLYTIVDLLISHVLEEEGSIKVVYHPRANRCHPTATGILRPRPKPRSMFYRGKLAPWAPFRTHGDFRFARNVANSDMSGDQIDDLLSLHHEAMNSPVTLRNHKEISAIEKRAGSLLTPVSSLRLWHFLRLMGL